MKRLMSFVFASLVILACLSLTIGAFEIVLPDDVLEPETPVYEPGDTNGDGEVNSVDVANLSRSLAGGSVEFTGNADVNGDGDVQINDLAAMRRYLAGGQM